MSGIFVTASKGGSLFQVQIHIIALLAETRASNRVMTLRARTVPLSPGAANKWLPCNPTPECCGANLVRVVRVVQGSRSTPALFASDVHPNEQYAHILVHRGIRQLQYRAFCVGEQRDKFLARLNVSHSCVVRSQGTSFGVVAAAVLVARHDSSSVSVLPFQLVQEKSQSKP